jgi:hypothetical protein
VRGRWVFYFISLVKVADRLKYKILCRATFSVEPLLKRLIKVKKSDKPEPNWLINKGNFVQKSYRRLMEPGAINFSAGWFAQGHTVNFNILSFGRELI